MSEITVKIDGLRELVHARAAAEAGANLVGFAFAATRRYVAPEIVSSIVQELPSSVRKVGLFVNQPSEQVRSIVLGCRLDYAQLCGDESVEFCRTLGVPVVKSFRVRGPEIGIELERYAPHVEWCILDGFQPNAYGGTGTSFDWELARDVSRQFRIMVAGGLTPENVSLAIRVAQPWGVDVSSGVETDGIKDVAKIAAFVASARQAAEELVVKQPRSA